MAIVAGGPLVVVTGRMSRRMCHSIVCGIDNLINSTFEELVEVDEIGDKIAESVVNYFSNNKNQILIEKLITRL